MNKIIEFTARMEIECDEYYNPETFEEAEENDYDSVCWPLICLECLGWEIYNTNLFEDDDNS